MKKNKINLLFIITLLISSILILIQTKTITNSTLSFINEGKSLLENGFTSIDLLTVSNSKSIMQGWLSSVLFYIVFKYTNAVGLIIFEIILNSILMISLYKLCMLLSNKKIISVILTFITDIMLVLRHITISPILFSLIFIILIIYCLELYLANKDNKYLILIPILSLLLVNLDFSLYIFVMTIILIYFITSIKIKPFKINLKLLFVFLITAVVGLINPYTYNIYVYPFNNINDSSLIVNLYKSFSINDIWSKLESFYALIVGLIFIFFREGNIKLRYILLFILTIIVSFIRVIYFKIFILLSLFPLAYFFKDMIKDIKFNKKINILLTILIVIEIVTMGYLLVIKNNNKLLEKNYSYVVDIIDEIKVKNNNSIYSSGILSSYLEYRGYKAFYDDRLMFIYKLSGNKYTFLNDEEEYKGDYKKVNKFLKNYDFDYIIIEKTNAIYEYLEEHIKNYTLIHHGDFDLYVNDSLYTEDELEEFKNKYKIKELDN